MKQVTKTPAIVERLKASFGPDVNVDDMAVFEVTALNNLPIRKKHPLYEGAIAQDTLMRDLVARINSESVPLQTMHRTQDLPSGRVFDARLNGQEVRALVALSGSGEAKLVADMDQGIIDQVSVNLLPKQILCSDCGWDYLGADASYENVYLGTCGNDHALRTDGVHAKMVGLDLLAEISLVNIGGAQGARIQSRDNQVYADPVFQRLAASGHSPALLLASLTPTQLTEETNMDLTQLTTALTDEKARVLVMTASLDAANAAVLAADASIATLTASLADSEAALQALKDTPAPEAPAAVLAFVSDVCKRSMVACGDQTPAVPETLEAQLAVIAASQAKLSAIIPLGGAALSAVDERPVHSGGYAPSAFRTAG